MNKISPQVLSGVLVSVPIIIILIMQNIASIKATTSGLISFLVYFFTFVISVLIDGIILLLVAKYGNKDEVKS